MVHELLLLIGLLSRSFNPMEAQREPFQDFLQGHPDSRIARIPTGKLISGETTGEFFAVMASLPGSKSEWRFALNLKLSSGSVAEEQFVDSEDFPSYRAALDDFAQTQSPGVTGGVFPGASGIAVSHYTRRSHSGVLIWSRRGVRPQYYDFHGLTFSRIKALIEKTMDEVDRLRKSNLSTPALRPAPPLP